MNLEDPLNEDVSYELTKFPIYIAKYREKSETKTCNYEYEDTYEGSISFTKIDRTNFIVSGQFEFSTVTQSCDTVRITDGRFDVQYIP